MSCNTRHIGTGVTYTVQHLPGNLGRGEMVQMCLPIPPISFLLLSSLPLSLPKLSPRSLLSLFFPLLLFLPSLSSLYVLFTSFSHALSINPLPLSFFSPPPIAFTSLPPSMFPPSLHLHPLTLTIAEKDEIQAFSVSCTRSWVLLEMMLHANKQTNNKH